MIAEITPSCEAVLADQSRNELLFDRSVRPLKVLSRRGNLTIV